VPAGSDALSGFGDAVPARRDAVSAAGNPLYAGDGNGLPGCRDAVSNGSDPVPGCGHTMPARGDAMHCG